MYKKVSVKYQGNTYKVSFNVFALTYFSFVEASAKSALQILLPLADLLYIHLYERCCIRGRADLE